jgi:hypothetical protein
MSHPFVNFGILQWRRVFAVLSQFPSYKLIEKLFVETSWRNFALFRIWNVWRSPI